MDIMQDLWHSIACAKCYHGYHARLMTFTIFTDVIVPGVDPPGMNRSTFDFSFHQLFIGARNYFSRCNTLIGWPGESWESSWEGVDGDDGSDDVDVGDDMVVIMIMAMMTMVFLIISVTLFYANYLFRNKLLNIYYLLILCANKLIP